MLSGINLLTAEFLLVASIIMTLGVAAFAGHLEKVKIVPTYILVPIIGLIAFLLVSDLQYGLVFDKQLLVVDGVSQFAKLLIAFLLIGALVVSSIRIFNSGQIINPHKTEYFAILLIAALGMMVMVSANDLISFYMGLEIQSLSLYILIAFKRSNALATEASLKYLILGAVGSGLFLYGTSLLFGIAGGVSYETLHSYAFLSGNNLIFLIGITLVLTALFFKLSAAPFHMWTPDVYQGAPTFVTTFVATAPKVAAVFGLLRMVGYAFAPVVDSFQPVIIFVSALSLITGAVMAIRQTSLLRMAAYSTITHMGYVLLGIASYSVVQHYEVAEYMIIYSLTSFGIFAFIGGIAVNNTLSDQINDFSGLAKLYPKAASVLTILLLSLAGIPPLAGFFIKFNILKTALEADLVILAVIAVISSAISAFYYLRVIKVIWFDPPNEGQEITIEKSHYILAVLVSLLLIGYVLYPNIGHDLFAYFLNDKIQAL